MFPLTIQKRIINLVVFVGPAITLAISPWTNFDPINLIKALILTSVSFAILGLVFPYFSTLIERVGKKTFFLSLAFCLAMLSSFSFSGAPLSQQLWGTFGRNTGLLTYLALVILLVVTASLHSLRGYERVLWGLISTVALMTIYCLFQIAKLDPIRWSAFYPFGTLGNVNFLSGFMGLGLVSVFVFALEKKFVTTKRVSLGILFLIGSFVLYKSDSTQGVVALFVGISTYFLIKSWYVRKWLFVLTSIAFIFGFISLFLGLLDKGPLRGLIYQFTVLYRADYMHAGIGMLMHNPLTGVGMDSYDDWYRAERGIISAFRTGLGRTANSAHNISLDVAAGGGFPLLICYLILLGIIAFNILKGLKKGLAKNSIFMAASMSWIAYQVQAAVSINQIGVGVWGWILGGLLLGILKSEINDDGSLMKNSVKTREKSKPLKKGSPNTPPPLPVISSVVLFAVGFAFSFMPFKADSDFAKATKSGSAELLTKVRSMAATNAFILAKSSADALNSNLPDLSREISNDLISKYPRNISGWTLIMSNQSYSIAERERALKAISEIDPYLHKCYLPNAVANFKGELDLLSPREKYKLARGWGLTPPLSQSLQETFSFQQIPSEDLERKLASLCG